MVCRESAIDGMLTYEMCERYEINTNKTTGEPWLLNIDFEVSTEQIS